MFRTCLHEIQYNSIWCLHHTDYNKLNRIYDEENVSLGNTICMYFQGRQQIFDTELLEIKEIPFDFGVYYFNNLEKEEEVVNTVLEHYLNIDSVEITKESMIITLKDKTAFTFESKF
jgi:hypothetical protein